MGELWIGRSGVVRAALVVVILLLTAPAAWAGQAPRPAPLPLASAASLPEPAPRIDLALFDGVQLSEKMLSRVRREVDAVFAAVGVRMGWLERPSGRQHTNPHPEIRVILLNSAPATWGLGERVMGAVLGQRLPRATVYVFYPSVLRTLRRYRHHPGPRRGSSRLGSESPNVATALARVLAHEVVHVLAPGRSHATSGLMQQRLDERDLLADDVVIDAGFANAFRKGLAAAIRAQRLLMATPEDGGPPAGGR